MDSLAEVLGWGEVARAGEGGEHAQIDVGEQHLGGQLRHLAPGPDHQLDAPAHHHLDGDGALEAGALVVAVVTLARTSAAACRVDENVAIDGGGAVAIEADDIARACATPAARAAAARLAVEAAAPVEGRRVY